MISHPFFYSRLLIASLLCATSAGCATPEHTISLRDVLDQEQIHKRTKPEGYRCTAGAHRGASVEHRENTLAALKAANDEPKYAFIEFDVQYTKDNRIVLFHDQTLMRQYGSIRAIGKSTLEELEELTKGEITTYEEAMEVVTKKLNIEIKSQGDPEEDARLADELIADLSARRRINDVMISSIAREVIEYINRTHPDIPTGQIFWLTSFTYLHIDRLTVDFFEEFNTSQADYLMLHVANLHNIHDLLKLKPKDKTIIFWDFDDKIYLVHKDLSDRMWGESAMGSLLKHTRYRLMSPVRPK